MEHNSRRPRSGNAKRAKTNSHAAAKRPQDRHVRTEVSAGGIVFKRLPEGIFVGFLLDPFNKWTFAKGHVEPGEKSQSAALRETEEEMGIRNLRVEEYLGKIDFWFQHEGVRVHKFVYYYLLEAPPEERGRPQREEHIQKIVWVPLREALARSSYPDIESVLKKAVAQMRTLQK
ncbi:MAG: NUDIX domain-containing protein [Patescibacteria group bacterium]